MKKTDIALALYKAARENEKKQYLYLGVFGGAMKQEANNNPKPLKVKDCISFA